MIQLESKAKVAKVAIETRLDSIEKQALSKLKNKEEIKKAGAMLHRMRNE